MKLIEKLLIANRGEIAVRIIRSAKKLGIRTVAVYDSLEEDSWHVRYADEAYGLGTGELSHTYLNIEKIISIARMSGCDAIHPGYGFLSENHAFAEACSRDGITFVGPQPHAILNMGNKILSRELAIKAEIPITLGLTGSREEILDKASSLPFPLLIKAAAGGGGKGMRIVQDKETLAEALEATSREAATYFGDGSVYLEQYILEPRHIEIQVMGDHQGHVIHLFERECSIQRRYQKIIEESPSPTLTPVLRQQMGEAAVRIARLIGYSSAGTVEFLVDKDLNFYFLEMNTRIQVEHPVTEMVTGIDLVEEQLLISSGYPLRYNQDQVVQKGHAIECRVYAEDPENNFIPQPGEITLYQEPAGKDIRIDSCINGNSIIRGQYDPMIAKLIIWGENRDLARQKMGLALDQYLIHGIKTNIPYLKGIMKNEAYRLNHLSTAFCQDHTTEILEKLEKQKQEIPIHYPVIAGLLFSLSGVSQGHKDNLWSQIGFWRLISDLVMTVDKEEVTVEILRHHGNHYHFLIRGREYETSLLRSEKGMVEFTSDGNHYLAYGSSTSSGEITITFQGFRFQCQRSDYLPESEVYTPALTGGSDKVVSPMPGKVVRVNISEGQWVNKGEVLLIVEAMKMENNILAPREGWIGSCSLKPGDLVEARTELVQIMKEAPQ